MEQEQLLIRSKSTGFLDKLDNELDFKCFHGRFCGYRGSDNLHASVSSIEPYFDCDATGFSAKGIKLDSGHGKSLMDGEMLLVLEQKIDKVSELLQEQHNLLISIKGKVICSKTGSDLQHATCQICINEDAKTKEFMSTNETINVEAPRGPQLDRAIEIKQDVSLDHIIRVALENFLQSDSVRDHVAAATAECVKGVVQGSFCRVVSNAYLPMVERSHRRLVNYVTKLLDASFADLEEGTGSLFKSIHKTSRTIRASLEKHQKLLEATDPVRNIKLLRATLKGVLEEELRTWRERLVNEFTSRAAWDNSGESEPDPPYEYSDYSPMSPMQPANPDTSVIDTLMRCALIRKHVEDGDVAAAFEEALSSADLALVMAACRAAEPAAAEALRPAALLALLQQLTTDMVHDTQLKCRYVEEAILRLEKCDAATRKHVPLVLKEVREHLSKFLLSYPKHHASRRIALIVMAANNLK